MPGLMIALVIKTYIMVLPTTVAFLAFRRLALSGSANAWLYAATGVFALLTTLGLLPWGLGLGSSHPVFFVFAAMAPAIWYGVVVLCNSTRTMAYDSDLERTFVHIASIVREAARPRPLLLEEPSWPDAREPVFRHSGQAAPAEHAAPGPVARKVSEPTRSVIDIARSMRGNASSEGRRIKLLPPPRVANADSLPFLRQPGTA